MSDFKVGDVVRLKPSAKKLYGYPAIMFELTFTLIKCAPRRRGFQFDAIDDVQRTDPKELPWSLFSEDIELEKIASSPLMSVLKGE